ncbi:MAG TPA: clostripain-related cysteine peptidase [Fimbriimonadaceae bacterium]|jgi:hypothetical protein
MRRLTLLLLACLFVLSGCGGGGGGTTTPANKSTWTILVYMNAANNLFQESPINIEQMQQAAMNSNVKIVVQWKQTQAIYPQSTFDGTRRYLITSGSSTAVTSKLVQNLGTGIDMGNPQNLNDFIAWGKANYPAQRYALVLWDHGNGWRPQNRPSERPHQKLAFSYDDQTGNAIQTWQLPTALGSQQLDMIVWDCSLMQMAEVSYELRANTRYVVGSEESPPAAGFPYNTILTQFQNNPGDTTLQLAESWVDGMNAVVGYTPDPIEESVIDTSQMPAYCGSGGPIDNFAVALNANLAAVTSTTATVRTKCKSYDSIPSPPRYYFDLYSLAKLYQSDSTVPAVQTAAQAVMNGLSSAVVYEKHNANSAGSNGLSIDFSPGTAFTPSVGEYTEMDFGKANRWYQWLTVAP